MSTASKIAHKANKTRGAKGRRNVALKAWVTRRKLARAAARKGRK